MPVEIRLKNQGLFFRYPGGVQSCITWAESIFKDGMPEPILGCKPTIFLMKKKVLSILVVGICTFQKLPAQEVAGTAIEVKGIVVDAAGHPVKGASIYVDSVETSVKTNRKGIFNISLRPETEVISAFSSDMGIFTTKFSGEKLIYLSFPKDNAVVAADSLQSLGFTSGQIDKTDRKSKKASKDYSIYRDIYQLLVAEIPGVQANGSNIFLRGTSRNSLLGSQAPLMIVDGTQVSSINFIQPSEIKSLQVLRDESASIYGIQGANGVIVIELKN